MTFRTKGRDVLRQVGELLREEAPTLLLLAGVAAALYGVGQLSRPAAWIVAGAVAAGLALAWARAEKPR